MDRLMFAMLLIAVPLQYYFLGFSISMPKFLTDLTSQISPIDSNDWLSTWIGGVVWLTKALFGVSDITLGELLLYAPRDQQGGVYLNIERPEGMLYKVGDVVVHKTEGLRGVIVSWDVERSESEEEAVIVFTYTVLLDETEDEKANSDYADSMTAQFFQHELQKITGHMISHEDMHLYFDLYDGERFLPRRWLRKVYPNG